MSISALFIDELKNTVDIVDVVKMRVDLKKAGNDFTCCCPFHDEKTPSFTVSQKKQFFYCFGCGAAGDVLKFIMDYDRLDFREAVDVLAGIAGVDVPDDKPLTPEQVTKETEIKRLKVALPEVMKTASGIFYNELKKSEKARAYLKKRDLDSETVKRFRLGMSTSLVNSGLDQQLMLEAALIKPRKSGVGFYDVFMDRIMFPIRNVSGKTVGFGGRVLGDGKPKYLNSDESKVFDKSSILYGLYEAISFDKKLDQVIVVEGYMDVVALARNGINNAVATMGTAFTEQQAKLAFRYTDEIVFCFDGDKAGRSAAEKAVEHVAAYAVDGKMVKFLFMPDGIDPDDYIKANDTAAFNALIDTAEPLSKALFRFMVKDDDDRLDLPEIQNRVVKRGKTLLSKFPDSIYKDSVSKSLSKELGVSVKDLKSPHPPVKGVADQKKGGGLLEPEFIKRYKLVEGTTNVFDSVSGSILKKAEFIAQVTKARSTTWFELAEKQTITEMEAYGFDQDNPFDRYVLLHGTMEAWDRTRFDTIPINALRISLGENYKLWENSPSRKQIDHDRLVFDPKGLIDDDDSYINRFRGLPLQPAKKSACLANRYGNALPIIDLLNLLCNGDDAASHWVTCWLAYPLQNVGAKLDTSLLFHGIEEGSGKTLLFSHIMRQIYGDYGGEFGQAQLDSAWNGWQADKLFGVFDEVVSRKDTYSGMGPLKQMVTSDKVIIERKFREGMTETNYMNAVFLSNETLPFPISSRDRRWFVIWPKTIVSKQLSARISQAELNGGVAEFYRYLLEYDLSAFNERTKPPVTDDKQMLIDYGLQGWEVFLRDWAAGELDVPFKACLVDDLYQFYQSWCRMHLYKAMNKNKFVLNVKRRLPLHHKYRYREPMKNNTGANRAFFVPGGQAEIDKDRLGNSMQDWATYAVVNFRKAINALSLSESS